MGPFLSDLELVPRRPGEDPGCFVDSGRPIKRFLVSEREGTG